MVYIYTEDSTSGFDFIVTIIKRVIQPRVKYHIEPLKGAQNCNKFLQNLSADTYVVGDVLVLYFDASTVDDACLYQAVDRLFSKNIPIYIQAYYCFESAFYSYPVFNNKNISFKNNYILFSDFKKCLEDTSKFQAFKHKYSKMYPHLHLEGLTLERAANAVFSLCTKDTPCIYVSKSDYNYMEDCLKDKTVAMAYYNNRCNKVFKEDEIPLKYNKLSYCGYKHKCGVCDRLTGTRGLSANLRHFYYNTVLSTTFNIVLPEKVVKSNKTLEDLLR